MCFGLLGSVCGHGLHADADALGGPPDVAAGSGGAGASCHSGQQRSVGVVSISRFLHIPRISTQYLLPHVLLHGT